MKIPVTGLGCVCALGADTEEIKKNIFTSPRPPAPAAGRLRSAYADTYPVFQAPESVLKDKKDGESYGFLFLRHAIDEALASAGLTPELLACVRVGVIAGTSVNASFNCFDFYKSWSKGEDVSFEPLTHYFTTPLSGSIQKHYGFAGPEMTVTTACASGTDAIGIGAEWLEQDICDIVIACGTDELNMIPFTGFIRLMIAAAEPCAPFSKGREGINLGEGAGVLILESPELVKKRACRAKGYILGYGTCADAYHATAPDPEGKGLKKAIMAAVTGGNVKESDIAFINAHGTGTQDNDAAEAKVFNDLLPGVPVMASKSATGHTLGAAGAVEAVLTLMCLNERRIPASANFAEEDRALHLRPVTEHTDILDEQEIALSDSLAFGGCNSVIAIASERYSDE
ncbi:3-oxoacyl-[acyl-carrier-protein] synthase-1/3-oxoacyl-[acyl-carrier-protein] synthase II [Parelusimicrobium proximum]|uniref:beta-ketoacyl-[acyl-carrier-protein] synthase family protein n=1 Tax=Parelusimicrobium proximum TaxID=3228953 RepID=UPI003D166323